MKRKFLFGEELRRCSISPVVSLRFFHSVKSRETLSHRSVNSRVPPNSFKELGLLALTTSFAIFRICLLLITSPDALVPIAIFSIFYQATIQKLRFPSFLKYELLALFSFFLQDFTAVQKSSSETMSINFNLCFDFLWGCFYDISVVVWQTFQFCPWQEIIQRLRCFGLWK